MSVAASTTPEIEVSNKFIHLAVPLISMTWCIQGLISLVISLPEICRHALELQGAIAHYQPHSSQICS